MENIFLRNGYTNPSLYQTFLRVLVEKDLSNDVLFHFDEENGVVKVAANRYLWPHQAQFLM